MASNRSLLGDNDHSSDASANATSTASLSSGGPLVKPLITRPLLLRNAHGKHIRSTPNGELGHTINSSEDDSATWKFEPSSSSPSSGDDFVHISHARLDIRLSASPDGRTITTSTNRGASETFKVLGATDGRLVFETTHHTHLSQDDNGLLSQSNNIAAWEQFEVMVRPSRAVSRNPSQTKLDVSLTPLEMSSSTNSGSAAAQSSPKATPRKPGLMAKIGNFLSPKGKKNSILMGDSSANLDDPSLQPINAMSSNDSKSAEPSMTRKTSISQSQLQQESTANSSPVASAPASPSLGPQTPPRRSSLSQNGPNGATVMLLTPPTEFGTSSSNVSPITVTLAPVNTATPPANATASTASSSSAASINLLSPPNAGGSVRGGHQYTPSISGLSFTSLPPGYRPQGDDGWGLSLYTPRGPGHLSVPSTGSAPGHHSTPSAAWGNSITVAQMEMFVHETSRAQEAQRGHLRDDSMFLPPASPPQGGQGNPQANFAPGGDPVLAAKLKERTNQVASLKKQISDLEDTIRQGKQLLADAASREGAHSKAIEDLRAAWQLEWNDHEAKLKEEYELRELQREKASADERVAVLNAQLLIVHDDRAREERGHQAEQKERKRLEKEVETLNWDIHNLEVALKRERERVALRPNEQSLKDWNELLNSLLKQERDNVADLKASDASHRDAEEALKRFTSRLMMKQKELQVEHDRITRENASLEANRSVIEAAGVAKFMQSEEGKRLTALSDADAKRRAEEAAAIEREKAQAQADAEAAEIERIRIANLPPNQRPTNNNRRRGIFACCMSTEAEPRHTNDANTTKNQTSKQSKQATQQPPNQTMT